MYNEEEDFIFALHENNINQIKKLLENGMPLSITFENEDSAVHIAIRNDQLEMLKILLPYFKNINQVNKDNETVLHLAIRLERISFILLILSKEPDLNIPSKKHLFEKSSVHYNAYKRKEYFYFTSPPLITSLHTKNKDIIKLLLHYGANLDCFDHENNNPIHLAIMLDDIEILEKFLQIINTKENKLTYLNHMNCFGWTPLRLAVKYNKIEHVKLLLINGSSIHIMKKNSHFDNSLLHVAAKRGFLEIIKSLIELRENEIEINKFNKNHDTPLMLAIKNVYQDCIQYLIEKGSKLDILNKFNESPLSLASLNLPVSSSQLFFFMLQILSKTSSSSSFIDSISTIKHQTPLLCSLELGKSEFAKILIQNNLPASLDHVDKEENNIFHYLAQIKDDSLLTLTLESKEFIKKNLVHLMKNKNKLGEAPLHIACKVNNIFFIETCMKYNIDITCKDSYGNTPFHITAELGNLLALQQLLKELKHKDFLEIKNKNGDSPLNIALEKKYIDCAIVLIEAGANVQTKNKEGITPVELATELNQLDLLKMLLKMGASANIIRKDDNDTPLLVAIRNRFDLCVDLLLEHSSLEIINQKDKQKRTALHYACKFNIKKWIFFLISKSPSHINDRDQDGMTPLLYAVSNNDLESVQALFQLKIDINCHNSMDETPLHIAAQFNFLEILKFLLEKKPRINVKNSSGDTPLECALQKRNTYCALELMGYMSNGFNNADDSGETPLHLAIKYNCKEVVELLLKKNVDVNKKNDLKKTPLMVAVELNLPDIVKILLDWGAKGLPEENHNSPLNIAASLGYLEVLYLLISKFPKIDERNNEGDTPLESALKCMQLKCAEILVKQGANINNIDKKGLTPVHTIAGLEENEDSIRLLSVMLEKKPNLEIRSKELGETAIMLAIKNGSMKFIQLLLQYGSSLTTCDNVFENNAFHWAAQNSNDEIMKLLLSMKKYVRDGCNARNKCGMTPFLIAVENNRSQIVTWMMQNDNINLFITDNDKNTALHIAAKKAYNSMILLLMPRFFNKINEVNDKGLTPLSEAISTNVKECIFTLIEKGSLVNYIDPDHNNYIHLTIKSGGDMDVLMYLIQKEVSVNLVNSQNETPLILAITYGNLEIIKLLIKFGASVEHSISINPNILLLSLDKIEILKYLLENYSELLLQKNGGENALHGIFLSTNPSLESAKLLLDYPIDINFQDSMNKKTVLHKAAERGLLEFVQLFLDKGVDVLLEDYEGLKAHKLALRNGYKEIHDFIKNSSESLQEHKPPMINSDNIHNCPLCNLHFSLLHRKHHCYHCGYVFCNKCTSHQIAIPKFDYLKPVHVCMNCYNFLLKENA